jgi:hypothetical protein
MNLPERKRQNGVYWVKRKDIHLWIMASYEFGWWKLFGIEHNYNDEDFEDINEDMYHIGHK